jgi:hypothetical protein
LYRDIELDDPYDVNGRMKRKKEIPDPERKGREGWRQGGIKPRR